MQVRLLPRRLKKKNDMQPGLVFIAPNGKLYRWYKFANWNCTCEIEGIETTELWESSLRGQKEDAVIETLSITAETALRPEQPGGQPIAVRIDFNAAE